MKVATLVGIIVAAISVSGRFADGQESSPEPQVLVRIKMIEASRTSLERAGFQFAEVHHVRTIRDGDRIKTILEDTLPAARTMGLSQVVMIRDGRLPMLEALENDGSGRVLAEPRLVTTNGRKAVFQVGVEIPAPRQGAHGSSRAQSAFVGTRLEVLPTIVKSDRIRLSIDLHVSEVDSSPTTPVVEHDGKAVPTLQTRAVCTAVELRSGQTLILSGPVQKRPIEQTATARASAAQKEGNGRASAAKHATEPKDVVSLVLIAADFVEPKAHVLAATPGSTAR
jgi:Flp pilus assembly secretin CpaC